MSPSVLILPDMEPARDRALMDAALSQSELSARDRVPAEEDLLNQRLMENCENLSRALLKYGNSSFELLVLSKNAQSPEMPPEFSSTPLLYSQRPLDATKPSSKVKHVMLSNSGTPARTSAKLVIEDNMSAITNFKHKVIFLYSAVNSPYGHHCLLPCIDLFS